MLSLSLSSPSKFPSLSWSGSVGSRLLSTSKPSLNPSSSESLSNGLVFKILNSLPSSIPSPSLSEINGLLPIPFSSPSVNPSSSLSLSFLSVPRTTSCASVNPS